MSPIPSARIPPGYCALFKRESQNQLVVIPFGIPSPSRITLNGPRRRASNGCTANRGPEPDSGTKTGSDSDRAFASPRDIAGEGLGPPIPCGSSIKHGKVRTRSSCLPARI